MRKPRYGIVAALGVVAAAVGLTVAAADRFRAGGQCKLRSSSELRSTSRAA
jgi:hypothetical protein